MNIRFHNLIISILLFLPQIALAANMQLEMIPLQNRMVDDVIHIIRPLVAPGGTVTGMNNQLIVKTTPENLAEIKLILNSIDHAPGRLMITVKQNIDGSSHLREDSLTGKYTSDNVQINTGHDHSNEGLSVTAGDEKSNIRYRTLNSTSRSDDRNTFKVQALEGRPAFISQGLSIPVDTSSAYITEQGVVVNQSIDYHEVRSGFYVLPRLNGDQVTLLAATDLSSVQAGGHPAANVQGLETTVTGRIGQWMDLGGIAQSFNHESQQNLTSSSSRGQEFRSVLIKVDEIK
jgi:type II secretory pathway component GspD/PulD (secretin)